jgi:hypothetical protein
MLHPQTPVILTLVGHLRLPLIGSVASQPDYCPGRMASLHGREAAFENFTRAGVVAPMAANSSQRLPARFGVVEEF